MSQDIRDALQFLLYPLTLAVAGYIFNSHLDDTKKTEVMEKFVPRTHGKTHLQTLFSLIA
jgi:hypothetical protein